MYRLANGKSAAAAAASFRAASGDSGGSVRLSTRQILAGRPAVILASDAERFGECISRSAPNGTVQGASLRIAL